MVGRRRRLVLAPDAQEDLYDILERTVQDWGARQSDRYRSTLQRALSSLRDFPYLGRHRNDVRENLYGLLSGEHIIFYRIGDRDITILRILPQEADYSLAFH